MIKKKDVKNLNYALVAKAHTPMYLMHKYWARKPHNVVSEYIKFYTKEGDIVLDPFSGSGVTAIEAIKSERKAIAVDLNPVSTFMTRCTAMPVEINKIKETFEDIKNKCKSQIEELYKTKCKECGNDAIILATIWDRDKKNPLEIRYYCGKCKKRNSKSIDNEDLKLIKDIEGMGVSYWYPKTKLAYNGNGFMKREKSESIDELYTKRNLISLSILYNEIEKIKENKIQEMFKFSFTSMSHLASRLTPVRPTRPISSFWAIQSYWIPPIFMESNVWMLFNSAIVGTQGIIRGKIDSNEQIKNYKEAKKFQDLNDGANIFIKTHNALELKDIIPKNSVDYVFTDPPYGGAVQYFELSTLWASWLKMNLDYNDEITINRQQNKDFEYYHNMLRASFKEIYQVLKPGKYVTVTFHSTDIKVWNSIIKAVVMVGFELKKIIYQPPARASAKGLLQPYGSAVGDYYIRFRKPEIEVLQTEKEIDMKTYEMEVVDAAKRIIGERGEPTIYQHILNGIMAELQGGRRVPRGAKNIDEVLKEHVGQEFDLISIKDEDGKTIGKKWWLKGADISHFSEPTLSDRIENSVIRVLESKVKASFDDILQAIFEEYPNALTPETEKIRDILKQYAIMSEGKWQLKPELKTNLTESAHNKMIHLLALLGEKAGFDVWIGLKEQSEVYENIKLETLVTIKKPSWRFIPTMNWNRINQIDVIWHEQGKVSFEFEVENTTAITEAIARGSNIPHDYLKRIIVIPKEREAFLYRKLKDPMLSENVKKNDWKFIFYQDLENFFKKSSKKFDSEEFQKLFKIPKETKQDQSTLKEYIE